MKNTFHDIINMPVIVEEEDEDEEVFLSAEYMESFGEELATNYNPSTTSVSLKGVTLEDEHSICHVIDALSTNTTLEKLTLWDVDIDDEIIGRLVDALSTNTTLKRLSLLRNGITFDGVERLASFLTNNTTLESLKISGNDIEDQGIETLGNVLLHSNITLRCLHVGGPFEIGENAAETMGRMLKENRTLEELHLLRISEGGISHIADGLKTNPTLKVLYLDLSLLTLSDLRQLGEMLSLNTTLKRLSLFDCAIEVEGVEEMLRHMYSPNTSLRILDLGCNVSTIKEMEGKIRERMKGLIKIKW